MAGLGEHRDVQGLCTVPIMAKKIRFKKPRISTNSPVLGMFGLRSYVKTFNLMAKDMPKRMQRGRQLFLLSVGGMVRDSVQRLAPEIDMGDEGFEYKEHLKVALVSGEVDGMDAVAIFFDNAKVKLSSENMDQKVLYFQATERSPEWVNVLMVYGPWPATMVPVPFDNMDAKVVSRNAREDEIKALAGRLYVKRGDIETDLRRAGATKVTIDKTPHGAGIVVHEDVGYNVLRAEFGFDGESQKAHWRPALKEVKGKVPDLMKRYLMYLKTGRESFFELPSDIVRATVSELNKGAKFASELAPFAPKG